MEYDIRYATRDEYPAVADLDGASFGIGYGAEALEDGRTELDLDRILVAVDADRIVGVSAELPFRMTLPGGGEVATTGLTWVSVELTHRRRGIVRSLIERQLRAAADAGIAAVTLSASEGGIYGRYGFGVATQVRRCVVQRRRARLVTPVEPGQVRRATTEDARPVLPTLYERWRRTSPGGLSRDERRWELLLRDRESSRRGGSALQHLLHPDGYLSYRVTMNWGHGDPQGECEIVDYAPVTAPAHAALWQTLLGMDLVATITSYRVPLDDPLALLLADPRGVDTAHLGDNLWLRPTDVPGLLGARRYGLEIDGVVEVRDALLGDGRYRLRGGPDGAECVRTDKAPDLTVAVAELGGLCLGGVRLTRLARAGLVGCGDPRLLRRLDLALLADREPAHGTQF